MLTSGRGSFGADYCPRYSAGPLIAIENTSGKYVHGLSVCSDCRLKR